MTIVAEHSIGRVWQEEGERNGDAFRSLNGTDPTLQIPLRMTYTTRPLQDLNDCYNVITKLIIGDKKIRDPCYLAKETMTDVGYCHTISGWKFKSPIDIVKIDIASEDDVKHKNKNSNILRMININKHLKESFLENGNWGTCNRIWTEEAAHNNDIYDMTTCEKYCIAKQYIRNIQRCFQIIIFVKFEESYVAGSMGLFLGMSCVTLLEIFIYLFKTVWGVFNDHVCKNFFFKLDFLIMASLHAHTTIEIGGL
uniref:Sodium channel protein Nach n=1 Tax=Heterorhabditis bacteriophora TaxID=37862 RepID=A0A1I7WG88_HETBA